MNFSRSLRILLMTCAISGMSTGAPAWAEALGWSNQEPGFNVLAGTKAKTTVTGDQISLESGEAVVEVRNETTLKMPFAVVHAKPKSLVFVRSNEAADRVFILLGSARVSSAGHSAHISSGEEVIVSSNPAAGYAEVAGQDHIGRRRVRLTKLTNKHTFATTEFSVVHALEREPLLYRLVRNDDKDTKALRDRLLKTAAVLNYVTSTHGPYTTVRR